MSTPKVIIKGVQSRSLIRFAHRARGAIFWVVISKNPVQKGRRPTTAGNQRCAGALPSLIISPIIIIPVVSGEEASGRISRLLNIGPIRKSTEPVTCAKK